MDDDRVKMTDDVTQLVLETNLEKEISINPYVERPEYKPILRTCTGDIVNIKNRCLGLRKIRAAGRLIFLIVD